MCLGIDVAETKKFRNKKVPFRAYKVVIDSGENRKKGRYRGVFSGKPYEDGLNVAKPARLRKKLLKQAENLNKHEHEDELDRITSGAIHLHKSLIRARDFIGPDDEFIMMVMVDPKHVVGVDRDSIAVSEVVLNFEDKKLRRGRYRN